MWAMLLFCLGVFVYFWPEFVQAFRERQRERARYVCRVSGEAWERANRK